MNEKILVSPPSDELKQKIILDTNIFSDLTGKSFANKLTQYLEDLTARGFEFALSDITFYELLRGQTKNNAIRTVTFLSKYFRYSLTLDVLTLAAQLDNLMKMEGVNVNGIDHGDKLIAATAILTGSLILTADVRGFHWPYFLEIEHTTLEYTEKKKTRCHVVGLLTPDFTLIKKRLEEIA